MTIWHWFCLFCADFVWQAAAKKNSLAVEKLGKTVVKADPKIGQGTLLTLLLQQVRDDNRLKLGGTEIEIWHWSCMLLTCFVLLAATSKSHWHGAVAWQISCCNVSQFPLQSFNVVVDTGLANAMKASLAKISDGCREDGSSNNDSRLCNSWKGALPEDTLELEKLAWDKDLSGKLAAGKIKEEPQVSDLHNCMHAERNWQTS